jgi:hypothetical protein
MLGSRSVTAFAAALLIALAGQPAHAHDMDALYQAAKLSSQYRLNDQFQRFMTEDPAKVEALRLRFKGYTGEVKGPEIR